VFMQPPITDMMELWKECGHVWCMHTK
jgi:hypothetical protein